MNEERICEAKEHEQLRGASIFLKQSVKIPPRMVATVEVDINTTSTDKIKMVPDQFCPLNRPNMYMVPLYADLSTKRANDKIPFSIAYLSNEENLYLPKDFVVGFAEKDTRTGEIFKIAYNEDEIQIEEAQFKNWLPQRKTSGHTSCPDPQEASSEASGCMSHTDQRETSEIDLHKLFTTMTNFIKSPAEVDPHRKVDLNDQNISTETMIRFQELCQEYDDIVSKNSGDIGKTLLVEMDIDTGDSPPIAQRPYCLPLQHSEWVKKEIDTLERADIITKSISPSILFPY